MIEQCFVGVCFIPLSASAPKFFGFSEFLAGLALMVLAWTTADVRYRFRIRAAPIPLQSVTYGVVVAIGVLTLLTDLWRAEEWLVPAGNVLTPASWQAVLAGMYLLTFLVWAWFAFIKPPIFGKRNAERFASALYRSIVKGSQAELVVIADELSQSATALVRYAPSRKRVDGLGAKLPPVEGFANDLLLLIADKRLCRAIVETSPGTAHAIFTEISNTKKYDIQVGTFAKNIVMQALADNDSFLYHEAEGYQSGLIGYQKPLSQALFGNFQMVETIGTLLDPDYRSLSKWDSDHWDAYCRVVLMTFQNYVDTQFDNHSFALHRATGSIQSSVSDLYKLNGQTNLVDNDSFARLGVVVQFIKNAVEILEKKGVPTRLRLRVREVDGRHWTFYDRFAQMIFEVIFSASAVTTPDWECWVVQHNSLWGDLFHLHLDGKAGRVLKMKTRRLLYNEIADMRRFPNFKGARILAFCLNVLGLELGTASFDRPDRPLHKAVLSWVKKNFDWLHATNPRVAEACLICGMTYNAKYRRLVKVFPAENLRLEAHTVYFEVDPAPDESKAPS